MNSAMEMAMVVISSATVTGGDATLEPMERNKHEMQRSSEVLATGWPLGDWRSRIGRAAWQDSRELAQQDRTITQMATLPETHAKLLAV
jgi:hypothetical protein